MGVTGVLVLGSLRKANLFKYPHGSYIFIVYIGLVAPACTSYTRLSVAASNLGVGVSLTGISTLSREIMQFSCSVSQAYLSCDCHAFSGVRFGLLFSRRKDLFIALLDSCNIS